MFEHRIQKSNMGHMPLNNPSYIRWLAVPGVPCTITLGMVRDDLKYVIGNWHKISSGLNKIECL
jgi:hypothetical protein